MSDYVPNRFRNIPLPQRMAESQRKPPRQWRWIRCSTLCPKSNMISLSTDKLGKYLKEILRETGVHVRTDFFTKNTYVITREDGSVSSTTQYSDVTMMQMIDNQNAGMGQSHNRIKTIHIRHDYTFAIGAASAVDEINFSLMMAKPFEYEEMDFFWASPSIGTTKTIHYLSFTAEEAEQPKAKEKVPKKLSLDGMVDLATYYPTVTTVHQSKGRLLRGKTQPVVIYDFENWSMVNGGNNGV